MPNNFHVAGRILFRAELSGGWGSDNQGLGISLNGRQWLFPDAEDANFEHYPDVSFSYTNGFQAGINTLDSFVNNEPFDGANPEALRVDVSGIVVTPEPGFYGIVALGLSSLVFVVRRRRQA